VGHPRGPPDPRPTAASKRKNARRRDEVLDVVKDIAGNPAGLIILGAILRTPKQLAIKPYSAFPNRQQDRECNAVTGVPDDLSHIRAAAPKEVGAKG
jgi:hypothetical protein